MVFFVYILAIEDGESNEMMRLISKTFPSVKLRDFNPTPPLESKNSQTQIPISSSSSNSPENSKIPNPKSWSVYLILSTNEPIKTYVGITTDFTRRFVIFESKLIFQQILISKGMSFRFIDSKKSKKQSALLITIQVLLHKRRELWIHRALLLLFGYRLKQHNGEIRGGAKASSAGRPWLCACIITGFTGLSQGTIFVQLYEFENIAL